MAQALFDDHPLEQYLRNAGEFWDPIPGSTMELQSELDPWWGTDLTLGEGEDEDGVECQFPFIIRAAEVVSAVITAMDIPNFLSPSSPFVERFKYDVVSSTLLSVSLPPIYIRTPRTPLPTFPGQLSHSRTSSISTNQNTSTPLPIASSDSSYLIPTLALLAFAVFFQAQNTFLTFVSLGITVYTFNASEAPKHDTSPSLESLNELIASSNEWETVVQAAISFLDNDEQSSTYGAATPPSPSSSSLRIALHSSLLTTQTQCDNVRQLFSALTLPSELSQLSEMYAPPSPMASSFSHDTHTRPLSLPSRKRTSSMPSDPFLGKDSKRQTWNGSYSRLSPLGSPGFKARQKRRSDLSSLLQPSTSPSWATASAPVTPAPSLPFVSEESDSEYEDAYDKLPNSADGSLTFGAAALSIQRKRKTAGMEAFRLPPPSYFSPVGSPRLAPLSPRTPPPPSATYSSGSRFTPVHAARHPLSLSALHLALQSALAAKRFACSHLLALRFTDEEDDGYWEDVRSVMGLLTTTLVDASSRLSEAIIEVEQEKLRDQNPTPSLSHNVPGSEDGDRSMDSSIGATSPIPSRRTMSISFAPLPSHVSRFAAHVEAITSALDDARENLQKCVSALQEETSLPDTRPLDRRRRRMRDVSTSSSVDEPPPPPTSPALEAYERLRRELGVALRECERGRERLLDAVYLPDLYVEDEGHSGDDVPALGHDGSDGSDPFDIDVVEPESPPAGYAVVALEAMDGREALDDATSHLLLSASAQHLPPPGIEQVFEAESGNAGLFKRERSKLTREERIKLMKARRESGDGVLGLELPISKEEPKRGPGIEKWGPGGEVVQELKDVIWKVGERRRRMADANCPAPASPAPSAELLLLKLDEAPA
ncbi:hypothetical protein DXG01_015282 [Tephrocybe rancida]|nr:hypothetical protein DXG01_015282 [Tephrocybe rancida]